MVERFDGVSWRESPALAGSLPYNHHLRDRKRTGTRREGWQTVEALPCGRWMLVDRWRGGGDVVAIASPRSGRCGSPSLSLSADRSGRSGERLAMMWTVKTSDGAEGEARNWRRGRRHPSHWFSLFLPFFLLFCYALPLSPEGGEGRGRGRGGQDGRTSRRCPVAAVRWRCGGEVWRWHRPEPDGVAFLPSPCAMLRAREAASGWRWCGRCRHQTEQKRGEELAKIAAASFALVLSLPSLLLALLLCLALIT